MTGTGRGGAFGWLELEMAKGLELFAMNGTAPNFDLIDDRTGVCCESRLERGR
jgi:hypothetical protein